MIKYSTFIEEKPVLHTAIDELGREVLDDKPVTMPFMRETAPASLLELMHRLYASMKDEGVETFEDAEDFDVEDETGIEMQDTPYEQNFDPLESRTAPPESSSGVPDEPEKVTE